MASNSGGIDDLRKDLEVSSRGRNRLLSLHLRGGTKEHHDKSQSGYLVSRPKLEPSPFQTQV
jgi:hypothetical protein